MSTEFPTTLAGFGYAFNDDGQLRQIDASTGHVGDKPFDFNVSKDPAHNQRNYEALGDVLTEHVYDLMLAAGLQKYAVPDDIPEADATFVFANRQDFKDSKKLLILIHGSGAVRAGQWARSLIINNSINHGSQLPYIKQALQLGYDVIVTNPNDNTRNGKAIPHSGDPIHHALYVWRKFVEPATKARIAIAAHSYGGAVTMALANKCSAAFRSNVFAIGLTDSAHFSTRDDIGDHLHKIGRNWVTSKEPLDTPLVLNNHRDVPRYSAGHTKHEFTSWACQTALFEFFEKQNDALGTASPDESTEVPTPAKKHKAEL